MAEIDERLDRVRELLKDPDFLEGNGLSNEVNIRMFCYEAKDEMRVRHFVEQILTDQTLPCHLKENNHYYATNLLEYNSNGILRPIP